MTELPAVNVIERVTTPVHGNVEKSPSSRHLDASEERGGRVPCTIEISLR